MANKELNSKELNNINGGSSDNKKYCVSCKCLQETTYKTKTVEEYVKGIRVKTTKQVEVCKVCGVPICVGTIGGL